MPWSFFVLLSCLFVELLPECSFVELWSVRSSSCGEFFRRAAVGLSSSCCRTFVELLSDFRRAAESSFAELLSDFRRAAVGSVLSSSCCRSVLWSSCCSEQETVERMSLLSDAGVIKSRGSDAENNQENSFRK